MSGGAALAVGIWYQTLGASTALIAPWHFTGGPGATHGESTAFYDKSRIGLLIEYFDMDAALALPDGFRLIQFKTTSQADPPNFASSEIRDIFRNATQTILSHDGSSTERVIGFVVASNRPIGQLKLLQELIEGCGIDRNDPSFLNVFANLIAPEELFPSEVQEKTIRELARSITWGKASDWGVSVEECTNACLRALSLFTFAPAIHVNLLRSLHSWFYTWGILPTELETYTANVIGQLLSNSVSGTITNEFAIMCKVFESEFALPITVQYIWRNVIKDLGAQIGLDPPTPRPIGSRGLVPWLLPRPSQLRGLPFEFAEDLSEIDSDTSSTIGPPRIFVLVGEGGSGKSILMAQLFALVAGSVWDWEADDIASSPKFIGCPIIQAVDPTALDGIETSMMRWGGRRQAVDQTVERIALANGVEPTDAAVWLGLDGMDELSVVQLLPVARAVANYADNHPGIRFLLASRREQFETMRTELNRKGMLRELPVDEFMSDEPMEAVLKATEYKLRIQRSGDRSELGQKQQTAEIIESSEFETSIQQPLFVGIVRRLYEKGRLELIQSAYEGNADSLKLLATEYIYAFCERAQRRLAHPYVTARRIFQALRKLSIDATNPTTTTTALWKLVCEAFLDDHIRWNDLYTQCISSGLMKGLGSGAFEWKQRLIGQYLPYMEERPDWR